MRTMPRLIDDKRRKRRWVTLTLLILAASAVGVGWLNIRDINEQWRGESLALLHNLQAQSSWLENEMDASRDTECIAPKLDTLAEQLASDDNISLSDVDFALRTRKAECQEEAKAVAQQCAASVGEISDLRQHLSALLSDGTNIIRRLKELASSKEALDVASARKACSDRCVELQKFCTRKIMLSWDYETFMAEHRKFADYVKSKKQGDSDWRKIAQEHLSFVSWTNDLATTLSLYAAKDKYVRDRFVALQQFPFDRDNTVELTRTRMNDEMRRVEPLISNGTDLVNSSLRRVDEELSRYQASARIAFETLTGLQKAHGDFVDASSVTSASQLFESFSSLRRTTQESVTEHIKEIQGHLGKVAEAKKIVGQTRTSLGENNNGADERLVRICETGLAQVRTLSKASAELEASNATLTNYVAKVQAEAKDKTDKIAETLKNVEHSLPDWRVEGNGIVKELDGVRRDVIGVRTSADNLNKKFIYFRDNDNHGTMALLRSRMNKTFEMLKSLEAECTVISSCSNGVELKALMQRRDKAKKLVELVNQKVVDLSQDMEQFVADGTLRQIKFVDYTESFASQLQQGIRHFDFAVNIPSAGRHQIEIRFSKGGRSLYKMSPQKKHKVVLHCTVSGVRDKTTELSWEDMTSSWHGNVTLDGDYGAGINDIGLDLSFRAEGFRGETMPSGTWQYQYDSGFFSSSMQDNFSVEFWVDGIKRDILFGAPAQ